MTSRIPEPPARSRNRLTPVARWLVVVVVLALAGCSSSTLKLYARPNSFVPSLSGKTVAVVPPITFGGDVVNAVIFDRATRRVYALFGIIPFGGYSYGGPADVRAHYAIYDRNSGQRVWEAYFGVETRDTSPSKWPDYPLDPRTGPILGAAWSLAQDFQAAALRLLADDPRGSGDPADPAVGEVPAAAR